MRRFGRGVCAVLLATSVALPLAAAEQPPVGATGAAVTLYSDPAIGNPAGIATGPDGALWITNTYPDSIGRITTGGAVTTYADPLLDFPEGITAGPDGALWFTNNGNDLIGRVTIDGTFSYFSAPGVSAPQGITAGPDGALWFVNSYHGSIGRITTAGAVTTYTNPDIGSPHDIAVGADGALWFTNSPGSIGRVTTAGEITIFPNPSISGAFGITAGPDGALWFTTGTSAIGRVTTSGSFSFYYEGFGGYAGGIAAGPDGALWYTSSYGAIGRMNTKGAVSSSSDAAFETPTSITVGPDGAMWFASYRQNGPVGRITATPPGVPRPVAAVPMPNSSAKVIWSAGVSDGNSPLTHYVVTPYIDSVPQPATSVAPTQHTALVTGLHKGTRYQFAVAAQSAVGTGAPSLTGEITIGAPGQPGRPAVTKIAPGSLEARFAAPNNNGATIVKYALRCTSILGGYSAYGSRSPVVIRGLPRWRAYTCTVRAFNHWGAGPASLRSASIIP